MFEITTENFFTYLRGSSAGFIAPALFNSAGVIQCGGIISCHEIIPCGA